MKDNRFSDDFRRNNKLIHWTLETKFEDDPKYSDDKSVG